MGALRPGQMLDGTSYQVVRELGAGGMGVVYEIEHVRLKKRYVAKVIHDQIKNEDGAAKRMEREAQVLAGISHPNIVQVHDVGTTQEGVSYFVMEKLEGVDLRSMMKHGVTRLRSIEIITDVLDALEYVHRRGIVHRDIKPENVFLSEQPRGTVTKVLDFGIVHIFDKDGRVSQGRITKTGGFVGTLYYAAPEQMQGKPASPPNDVYAAGLVLFELLAGKGPFDDDPGVGLSRCFKPAPLLTDFIAQAPQALSDAVAKALEQDPERRPSAGALAAELRSIATALRSTPGVAEDEAIRAEVHDLLRHIAPVDDGPPRPAAGRSATPDPAAPGMMPGSDLAMEPTAAPATAAPATPVMADAPARRPSDPHARHDVTLASATGQPPTAPDASMRGGHVPASVVIGQPHAQVATAPPLTPTLLVPQHGATAHSMSAPPPSPRFPPGTERGIGPAPTSQAGPGYVHTPSPGAPGAPGNAHPSQPGQPGLPPPLFAATTPVRPVHAESTPGAPPRHGDTSPGVYATVDNQSVSAPLPKRTPWTAAITIAASSVVLVGLLIGGAFALRKATSSTSTTSAATATTTATATATTSATTSATEPLADAPAPPAPVAASAQAEAAPPAASATSSASAVAMPKAAAQPTPATQPAARTTSPAVKPAAARPTSTGRAVEKDGYVNTF